MEYCSPTSIYVNKHNVENAGQSHDIKIANKCFENVAKFRYLETTITNQNLIQEEIKRRLNSGNATVQSRTFVFLFAV
jgi:hypothetical protein